MLSALSTMHVAYPPCCPVLAPGGGGFFVHALLLQFVLCQGSMRVTREEVESRRATEPAVVDAPGMPFHSIPVYRTTPPLPAY